MISCCPPPPMPWNAASGASARCKRVSTGCGRKRRSVRVLRWICGVKPTLKAVNKPLYHSIVHVLDKPGSSATVSIGGTILGLDHGVGHPTPFEPISQLLAADRGAQGGSRLILILRQTSIGASAQKSAPPPSSRQAE